MARAPRGGRSTRNIQCGWASRGRLSFRDALQRIAEALGAEPEFVWLEDEELLATGVAPWSEVPLWMPWSEARGMTQVDPEPALEAGLTLREIGETAIDTLAWDQTGDVVRQADGIYEAKTLSADRAAEILEALAGKT